MLSRSREAISEIRHDPVLVRQGVHLGRWASLMAIYFLTIVPTLAINYFAPPSLWYFAASIGSFFVAGFAVNLWVLPRLQRKFDADVRTRALQDEREFVVILRSFHSQVLKVKSNLVEPGNLMANLSDAVPEKYAVVCIGAGETIRGLLRPSTYVPLNPPNEDWPTVFNFLAVGARAILVTPGATPGSLRELQTISIDPVLLAKSLVWMPRKEYKHVEPAWNQIKRDLGEEFNLPEYVSEGLLYGPKVDFSPDRRWYTWKGELKHALAEALDALPPSRRPLNVALLELDERRIPW